MTYQLRWASLTSLYSWHIMTSVLRHDWQRIFNQQPYFVEIFWFCISSATTGKNFVWIDRYFSKLWKKEKGVHFYETPCTLYISLHWPSFHSSKLSSQRAQMLTVPSRWITSTNISLLSVAATLSSGFLQILCSKIPWLFQSWNDNFPDLIKTITLLYKCQKWYTTA